MVKMSDCKVEGCGKKAIAKGLCRSHYYKDRNARIKKGEWTPTPIANSNKNVAPIEIDDDEKLAVQTMRDFNKQNRYYGRSEELLKLVIGKDIKSKLAKGLRTLSERGFIRLCMMPTTKSLLQIID